MNLAMIPARIGSQRLKKKNLRTLGGIPLIVRAIRNCKESHVFDEVWVNADHPDFETIAREEGVRYHPRPAALANNTATSEEFIAEFLQAHPCERLFQVHSIAPLLQVTQIQQFVRHMTETHCDTLLCCTHEQIECAYQNQPVNFSFNAKTNSQDLQPVQRIPWSITGWRRATYLDAIAAGKTATYAGTIDFFPLDRLAGHIIKTEEDLQIAEALLPLIT